MACNIVAIEQPLGKVEPLGSIHRGLTLLVNSVVTLTCIECKNLPKFHFRTAPRTFLFHSIPSVVLSSLYDPQSFTALSKSFPFGRISFLAMVVCVMVMVSVMVRVRYLLHSLGNASANSPRLLEDLGLHGSSTAAAIHLRLALSRAGLP